MKPAPRAGARMTAEDERVLVALGSVLDAERRRQRLTVATWAHRAGLSRRALRFRGLRANPRMLTIFRAAAALGLRIRLAKVGQVSQQRSDDPMSCESGGNNG
jgi:DNA-binding phage protein